MVSEPRRILSFVVPAVALVAFCRLQAATQPPGGSDAASIERDIRAINASMRNAVLHGDKAALSDILAEDYIGTQPTGVRQTKEELLKTFNAPDPAMHLDIVNDDFLIHSYGDTAILNFRANFKGLLEGEPFTTALRVTDTFVRRNGKWKDVARHVTRIAI